MLRSFKNHAAYDFRSSCSFFLGEILVLLVCQGLAGVIATAVGGDIASNGDFNTAFMIVIQLAVVGYIFVFSKVCKRKLNFEYFKSENGGGVKWNDIVLPIIAAAVIMIGMYLPATWYGYFTQAIGIPPEFGSIDLTTVSAIVMMIIATTVCAPIVEETVFRGVLFHGLNNKYSVVKSVLLSALAFMLMHMNPLQVVYQFALGALAACIVYRSGKLLPSIILHASSNALALVMSMTPLGTTLANCELWLVDHVAAATFITIGLFVACGLVLFLLVRFGYDFRGSVALFKKLFGKKNRAAEHEEKPTSAETDAQDGSPASENMKSEQTARSENDQTEKPRVAFCPRCGKPVDGRFCGNCGYDTSTVGDPQAAAVKTEVGKFYDSNAKVKFWIGIGICAIMFVINLVSAIVSGLL